MRLKYISSICLYRLFSVALAIAVLTVCLPGCKKTEKNNTTAGDGFRTEPVLAQGDELDTTAHAAEDFVAVCENESAALYLKAATAEVMYRNKVTDTVWYTNPPDRADDQIAMGNSTAMLNSQFWFTYFDNLHKSAVMYSASDSVEIGQVTYQRLENGFRASYLVGKQQHIYRIPVIIAKDKLEALAARLDEYDADDLMSGYELISLKNQPDEVTRKTLIKKYPSLEKTDLYIFKYAGSNNITMSVMEAFLLLPEYLGQEYEELFLKAGYTDEEWRADCTDNGLEVPEVDSPVFAVAIEFVLDGDELVVRVPHDSFAYDNTKYRITDFTLLPFFGAAKQGETGYIIVPDGSGALINFDNGKTKYSAYEKKVYGENYTIMPKKQQALDDAQIYLPVYALHRSAGSVLAIIESGDAEASIHASISGISTSYNQAYASFALIPNREETESVLNISGGYNYQENPLTCDLQLRYRFLAAGKDEYSEIALAYQDYLLENGLLKQQKLEKSVPLTLNLLGAIRYDTAVMGIPVRSTKSLTSYGEAVTIMSRLRESSVDDIKVIYTGWNNRGLSNTPAQKVQYIKELGGKAEFKKLLEYTEQNGIAFYPDAELVYVSESSLFNRFRKNTDAARSLSGTVARKYTYLLDLGTVDYNTAFKNYIVKPSVYKSWLGSFISGYEKDFRLPRLSLGTLGTDLNADYREGSQTDRQQAKQIVTDMLRELTGERKMELSVKGGNGYLLSDISSITEMAVDSGHGYLLDDAIPFYEIVLHGIMPYAGAPLNKSSDFRKDLLKAVETGAEPYFEWMYAENYVLKDTDYNNFGIHYADWLDEAVEAYRELNEALGDCRDARIIEHEKLFENVYCTRYSNGTSIYTNYGDSPVTVNGVTVNAVDWTAVKGEK